ncbi:MAG: HAD-IA family hydrolase [Bacteroidales bacterium]|nr:HAD-IA family hydrolase [Bacteroidales bacterium]
MDTGLAIFDLDGTLLYTAEDLGGAVDHALKVRGLPRHTTQEYVRMVGHGIRNLVTRALPEELRTDDRLIDEALVDFKSYYEAHIADTTVPYPGIVEIMDDLSAKGVKLAVASNKYQKGTEILIRKFFPSIDFVAILGNCERFPLKPDAAVVEYILDKAGVAREKAVMVGDSGSDIKTALNGHIRSVAVTWGYRDESALLEADTLAHTPAELRSALGL